MMATEYHATCKWVDGLQFVAKAEPSGVAVVMDAPEATGGAGSGVTPMHNLLLSLGGCTAMDVISILQKKRQNVTAFWVEIDATRAEEHPRRYTKIALTYVVRGYNVDPAAVERSIELSQEKYCGVTATLNAEITHTYRIEEQA